MFHICDCLPDSNGDLRHLLWRGCDGSLTITTRPFEQDEQAFFSQHHPDLQTCCEDRDSRTYVCSNLRVVSRAAGSSWANLSRHLLPLDLAARMCWPRRKHWDPLHLARDYGTVNGASLWNQLSGVNRRTDLRLTHVFEPNSAVRDQVAANYCVCLHELATVLSDDLSKRGIFIEDELGLSALLRRLETDPLHHLVVQPAGLLDLIAKKSSYEAWSSSSKGIAKAAGIMGDTPAELRVPSTWTEFGTWTGRCTSSNPCLQSAGEDEHVNTRELLGAREGYTLVSVDFRKAELQALAKLTGQDRVNSPSWMVYEPLPPKSVLFRILYGGGNPEEIAALPPLLRRSMTDIRRIMEAYNAGYPGRPKPLGNVALPHPWCPRCPSVGHTCKLCGRKRESERRDASHQVNWMLQTSVSGAMRFVLPALDQALRPHGGYIVLPRHDEVVLQCPDQQVDVCRSIAESYMSFREPSFATCAREVDDRWGQWDVSSSTGKTLQALCK